MIGLGCVVSRYSRANQVVKAFELLQLFGCRLIFLLTRPRHQEPCPDIPANTALNIFCEKHQ